jgi:hypothetical protein
MSVLLVLDAGMKEICEDAYRKTVTSMTDEVGR